MSKVYRQGLLRAGVLLGGLIVSYSSSAANWLMVQGTEPAGAAARAKLWGFVQPEFQYTEGSELPAGPFAGTPAAFNQIRPDLNTNASFSIRRARIGVRGTGLPLDSLVNYFLLAEFGNNGITRQGGGSAKATDASITLNHIPGARIRIGQFKYPGSEEGLQAIHVFDYINFTNGTDQLLLERFFDNASGNSSLNGPVGAFRDIGMQIFDTFKLAGLEHTYAVMVGNGNGISRGDNNEHKDGYLYWSTEKIFAGKGPRRDGLKGFAWFQDGKRTLDNIDYDRERWGLGTTFRKDAYRATAEYVSADGVIFNGTSGAGTPGNGATFSVLPNDKADAWYLDIGYKVSPNLELDVRFDHLNRGTEVAATEREFETLTFGVQYFLNKKSRVVLNYEMRDAEAPNLPGSAGPNRILDEMDDRISTQLLVIF